MGTVHKIAVERRGQILEWPKHHRKNHPPGFWCDDSRGTCYTCTLFICTRCNGAEAELTTDCPGEPMHEAVIRDVLNGKTDYVSGQGWIEK